MEEGIIVEWGIMFLGSCVSRIQIRAKQNTWFNCGCGFECNVDK